MGNPIVTLTTDFGLTDPYVAEMKAVILSISPKATIVDISHQIRKFDIKMGAYVLATASTYFPKKTIHVAIVDPDVGTKRRPILIQTKHNLFLGPDNGILAVTAENMRKPMNVYAIANRKLMLPEVSRTFHGRDIFAPIAAHLANGTPPEEVGPKITRITTPNFSRITKKRNLLMGEVIHIDDFGNVITNFLEDDFKSVRGNTMFTVKLGKSKLKLKLCKTYADVEQHQPLAIIGSHKLLEISLNQGNAAEAFSIESGDKVTLYIP